MTTIATSGAWRLSGSSGHIFYARSIVGRQRLWITSQFSCETSRTWLVGNKDAPGSDIEADKGSLFVKTTLECYVSAIVDLYEEQVAQGTNSHPHPRGPGIKALLQSRDLERSKNDRESLKDRGKGAISSSRVAVKFGGPPPKQRRETI
jgi:hypothetical protein